MFKNLGLATILFFTFTGLSVLGYFAFNEYQNSKICSIDRAKKVIKFHFGEQLIVGELKFGVAKNSSGHYFPFAHGALSRKEFLKLKRVVDLARDSQDSYRAIVIYVENDSDTAVNDQFLEEDLAGISYFVETPYGLEHGLLVREGVLFVEREEFRKQVDKVYSADMESTLYSRFAEKNQTRFGFVSVVGK